MRTVRAQYGLARLQPLAMSGAIRSVLRCQSRARSENFELPRCGARDGALRASRGRAEPRTTGMSDTKWDQLQTRLKNSWIGIVILALVAIAAVVAQFGDSVKKVSEWMGPAPAANLHPIVPTVTPLD